MATLLTSLSGLSDSPAIIIPSEPAPIVLSHQELLHQVFGFQQKLAAIGISPKEAVAIALPNSIEFIVAFLATALQQAICAPLNPAYKQEEFDFYIADLSAVIVLVSKGAIAANGEAVRAARDRCAIAEILWNGAEVVLDMGETADGLRIRRHAELQRPQEEDVALILHTSGTTGTPKAVPLTHKNLCRTMFNLQETYQLTALDRTMLVMPLFHVHGLLAGFLSPLMSGGSVVIPPRFSTSDFWPDFIAYKANWYTAVPTIHQILLKSTLPSPVPSIRFIRSCSSPLSPTVHQQLERRLGAPVLEAYAMTEAVHQMTSNPLPPAMRKPGSVGQAQGLDLKIMGESGDCLPQGEVGEVCVSGPNVTSGYLTGDPRVVASTFTKSGFLRTGDRGYVDNEGYLFLTGRIKELINKGGEKISPIEIDNLFAQHSSVLEAVSFAIDDELYGQDVAVAIALNDGCIISSAELLDWFRQKAAKFKVPKKVYLTADMPKTATGKVQRRLVAKTMVENENKALFRPKPLIITPEVTSIPFKKISTLTGAALIARVLHQLGVKVIFGLVGIPVVQIAEEAIALGIQFIGFRNEQAASYAATAYGYLSGRPGICLVVGGPGVLHAMAGIGNSSANAFPMLLLAGSCETYLTAKGAFQELDAVSLLAPHAKLAVRASLDTITDSVSQAYRASWYGRAGPGFVDLPADVIRGEGKELPTELMPAPPRAGSDPERITRVAQKLRSAKAPLIIIGKGAAYARAEAAIRELINQTNMPFLPTPMGKGVLPDSHPLNTASARSTALQGADVVLILGARLNWILHFGEGPKWSPSVELIQVDTSAEEIGKNNGNANLGIIGDINIVVSRLSIALSGWRFDTVSPYMRSLKASAGPNEARATKMARADSIPMNYHRTFATIKQTLHKLSPSEDGNTVFVSEGANTMDVSRSVFAVEQPRLRLDAGANATMGVGLGYAIAAYTHYNFFPTGAYSGTSPSVAASKKIVCIEGDSAFGFSMPEVETMARYGMDILIFVINNGGIYHGDSNSSAEWLELQKKSRTGSAVGGLRSTSLGWEVEYEKMAEMCGGVGYLVRTPEELQKATEEGFRAKVPVVVNVIIEAGQAKKLEFAWQNSLQRVQEPERPNES